MVGSRVRIAVDLPRPDLPIIIIRMDFCPEYMFNASCSPGVTSVIRFSFVVKGHSCLME